MTAREILKNFLGPICVCGRTKQPTMSHCRRCYFALPKAMQRALYKRFGQGYEAAFLESCAYLEKKAGATWRKLA